LRIRRLKLKINVVGERAVGALGVHEEASLAAEEAGDDPEVLEARAVEVADVVPQIAKRVEHPRVGAAFNEEFLVQLQRAPGLPCASIRVGEPRAFVRCERAPR